ncbi:unnamed protein product, partial [Protopolystoma xenopodis]
LDLFPVKASRSRFSPLKKINTSKKTKFIRKPDVSDDDDVPEEWDRFESLHDDPYNIERANKMSLKYEDKSDHPWEKGGSGLVFHTDERTWRKLDPLRKEEFFDEPSSFDWDIDMEAYEDIGAAYRKGCDMDTLQLIEMHKHREEEFYHCLEKDKTIKSGIAYSQSLLQVNLSSICLKYFCLGFYIIKLTI